MKTKTATFTVANEQSFFARGKAIAKQADTAQAIKPSTVLSFEDTSDMLRERTAANFDFATAHEGRLV